MSDVVIEPDDTARRIRGYLRANQDLRHEEYDRDADTLDGLCYVAAEAYFHAMGGTDAPLDIYCLSWGDVDPSFDGTHWYLRDTDRERWVDLGLDDVADAENIPFGQGTRRAFITGYEPSQRTEQVLSALDIQW